MSATAQHMRTLNARSAQVRGERAKLKREIGAMSSYDAAHLIADVLDTRANGLESDYLKTAGPMAAEQLVCSIRRFGRERWRRMCARNGLLRLVASGVPVSELTSHEASVIADFLRLAHPATSPWGEGESR